jgi:AcrR family transcriptional regulator
LRQRAGVSAESIYKGFGSKAALAKAVFDLVIAGDDEPVAVRSIHAMADGDRAGCRKRIAIRNPSDVASPQSLVAALVASVAVAAAALTGLMRYQNSAWIRGSTASLFPGAEAGPH